MKAKIPEVSAPLLFAFCRTMEEGSFTRAARALALRPAAVSRAIAKLEEQLGVALFRRTTRQLRPTPAAERYYQDVREALDKLAAAENSIHQRGTPRGRVRLSVPTTWGLYRFLPLLEGFREAHPAIELDVQISNTVVDFVRDGFDFAVRLGRIEDSGLVAKKLGDATLGVFASERYLAKHGTPHTTEELQTHTLLAFVLPGAGRTLPWVFANPEEEFLPPASVRCFDDPRGLIALACAGVGLCQLYHFMVEGELADKQLIEVLPSRRGRSRPFSLLYSKQTLSPAAKALLEHVLARRK